MSVVEEIVEEIESMTEGMDWSLSLESLLGILGVPREEFYRLQYARRKRQGIQMDSFGPETAPRLIEILSDFGYSEAASGLTRAGVYFDPELLDEWQEFFLSVTTSRLMAHHVNRDELENALAACRNPGDGLDFYCENMFQFEELISFSAELFLKKHTINNHSFSRGTLGDFLDGQYTRRSLKREDLFEGIKGTLLEKAISWGILSEADRPIPKVKLPAEINLALSVLEFRPEQMPNPTALKKQYRSLLKKYHPDINPTGLEKTRKINEAYTFLISRVPVPG